MATFMIMEQAFIDRLSGVVPKGTYVFATPSLAYAVNNTGDFCPAVHIIYEGYSLGDTVRRGLATIYTQKWLVVVAVKNVRELRSGQPARAEASTLIDVVHATLNNWQPGIEGVNSLRPVETNEPAFESGLLYFPFAYQADLSVIGNI